MAPCIDDLCVRQYEADKADMQKIIRHLVDEKRGARTVHAGIVNILRTKTPEMIIFQLREYRRVPGCAS